MSIEPDAGFLKKLTATFLVEAREHVQTLGTGLLELEQAASRDAQLPLVETVFRELHSLKGAARSVNAGQIERLCQTLEGTFGDLKTGQCECSTEILDRLHQGVTVLGQLMDALEAGESNGESRVEWKTPRSKIGVPASNAEDDPPIHNPQPAVPNQNSAADTIRIATTKLDAIFVQAEEMLGVKLAQAERTFQLRTLAGLVAERDRLWRETLPLVRNLRQKMEARVDAPGRGADTRSVLPELPTRLLALLDRDREHAEAVSIQVADLVRTMADDQRRFDTVADRLLEDVKNALMQPFEATLAGFPKMVRDMAKDAGKEIDFHLSGTDIEIDKRILEKIKDPLLHVARNSVDHGIELPAERSRRGKASRGSLTLAISQAGGKVEITVSDDGAGMDVAAVKAAAVKAGSITAEAAAALRDQDAWQLVFGSGVSTSQQVTTVSGRGLGMAIVQEGVAKLGGTVSIESTPGVGTTVRIVLPLTLATLRGTLVRAANREFIIPTANVARVARVMRASIKHVENRDCICLDGTMLALIRLADVLGLVSDPTAGGNAAALTVLVLEHGPTRIAFAVEQVIGEQEVLAKPLGRLLPRVQNLAGGTVFGTGRVVPILSVPDLLQSAVGCARTTGLEAGPDAAAETARARRLLVADDSITARTLLQSILESSGYSVKTAPDGAAAFDLARTEPFDLVVSDVEMPRMDGFELTKRVRAEPALGQLPVVLVTSRDADEDRERGLDAGANAYIVKSSFDQSNLLDVIGTLI